MSDLAKNFISELRRSLSQNAGLDESERKQIMQTVETAYRDEPPPTLVLIGETGVGKSTTINALFNAGQPVGHTRATTMDPVAMRVTAGDVAGSKGLIRVFDMPGVGDDIGTYKRYRELYLQALGEADVVLWVHPADDRMVQLVQTVVHDLFGEAKNGKPGLVFALNKADAIHPRDWNPAANVPSKAQMEHLAARERDFLEHIRAVLPDYSGRAIAYSALRRYNLAGLFMEMMTAVAPKRRWVLESRMDLAAFAELVDKGMLETALSQTGLATPNGGGEPEAPTAGKTPELRPSRATPAPEELLEALPEEEYRTLVSDRSRFLRWMRSLQDRRESR